MAHWDDKMLTFLADMAPNEVERPAHKRLPITKLGVGEISKGRTEIKSE
jgi:hypothetical protein